MPYRYLGDIATADVAFEASGKTVEEMFRAAADATMNVMVADLSSIADAVELRISVEQEDLEMLLFNFLQELIFYKDSQLLLLLISSVAITRIHEGFSLVAIAHGEKIDPSRHRLLVDVKAVTMHRFSVQETATEWKCSVVLDI